MNENIRTITRKAGENLSNKEGYFVDLNTDGDAVVANATDGAIGVLHRTGDIGHAVTVAFSGAAQVVASGAIGAGVRVAPDANGKAVASTTGSGVTLTESTADGDYISVLLNAK